MNKKLWHRNKRGLIILGLFFFSLHLFAQEPAATDAFAPGKATVETATPTPSPEPTNGTIESEINDEMDASAEELIKQQRKIKEQVEKLQNPEAGMVKQSKKLDPEAVMRDFIHASNPELSREEIDKLKLHQAVSLALVPLRKMSTNEMRSMILEQTRGQKIYTILVEYPKLLTYMIELIRHEQAIPQLVKIVEDKDRLKKFAAVMLCSILIGFLIARFVSTKEKNLKKIFFLFIMRVLIMFSLRISIIMYFFSEELAPSFNVFLSVFFN